jgi:hypothetical protein
MKLPNRPADNFAAGCSKESDCRRVSLQTDALVVEDENGIECAIKDRLEFTFCCIEQASCVSLFAPGQNHETKMKEDRHTEGHQYEP